jgi:hypothetical protein
MEVGPSDLYELPKELECIPPQVAQIRLAFLKLSGEDREGVTAWIVREWGEYILYLHVVYWKEQRVCVLLYDRADTSGGTLNMIVLNKGGVRFFREEREEVEEEYGGLLDMMKQVDEEKYIDECVDE